ncbi:methylamine utilization protein [Pseudomonas sp.]|uniref:methylamine utilization protein n=1 Tax=Pseudomonas sp. TaxID=306 RepID=UPI002734D466|nr:methylamine utilization protein [Pseudomonas sp.]MDP3817176.1 methylamine utilization protein [Pseudomonas sp.]
MGKSAWALLIGLLGGMAEAASLQVEVRDIDGKPLSEAVLWVEPGPTQAKAEPALMDQQKRQFKPYILPVQVGTTVSFPNSDPINHHVYSFSPAKRFELRLHQQNAAPQEVRFDQPGLVTLGCNIHDWMLGFILVLDSPWFSQTDAKGHARLDFEPAAGQQLRIWHPRLNDASEAMSRELQAGSSLSWQLSSPLKRDPRPKVPVLRPQGKGGYMR